MQPEKTLDDFGFFHLQPLVFDNKNPSPKVLPNQAALKKSNKRIIWPAKLKDLLQFVAVCRFVDDSASETTPQDYRVDSLVTKLNEACRNGQRDDHICIDPSQRSLLSTKRVLEQLGKIGMPAALYSMICEDIAKDEEELKEKGFDVPGNKSEDTE